MGHSAPSTGLRLPSPAAAAAAGCSRSSPAAAAYAWRTCGEHEKTQQIVCLNRTIWTLSRCLLQPWHHRHQPRAPSERKICMRLCVHAFASACWHTHILQQPAATCEHMLLTTPVLLLLLLLLLLHQISPAGLPALQPSGRSSVSEPHPAPPLPAQNKAAQPHRQPVKLWSKSRPPEAL
jgi:hypothetical protein